MLNYIKENVRIALKLPLEGGVADDLLPFFKTSHRNLLKILTVMPVCGEKRIKISPHILIYYLLQ